MSAFDSEQALSQFIKRVVDRLPLGAAVRELQGSPRVVWGVVNADGTVASGSGDFSVVKVATGEFRVTYGTAFSAVPATTGSARPGGTANAKSWQHDTEAASASAFRCSVRASTTAATIDVGFHFHSVGPR